MRMCVCGIPCSGKDTLINLLLKEPCFKGFRHYKGSFLLNTISGSTFGKRFWLLTDSEKETVRRSLTESLQDKDDFFVDGHFCFPVSRGDGYETVFTDSDLRLYDVFIYLKSDAKDIQERIAGSEKNRRFSCLPAEKLHDWQCLEIQRIRELCFYARKDFIILDGDFESALSYLSAYATDTCCRSLEISGRIAKKVLMGKSKRIALIDCDRTLTEEDATVPFFRMNGGDESLLRAVFADGAYSSYQFWRLAKLYEGFTKYPDIAGFHLNSIVVEKIARLRGQGYAVYGLTSGVLEIWKGMNDTHKFFECVIGNDLSEPCFVISDLVKGFVAKLLREDGCHVVTVGDSICDIFMLEEADDGYIYAPNKIRPNVQEYIFGHPETKIKQFQDNPFQYTGVKAEG